MDASSSATGSPRNSPSGAESPVSPPETPDALLDAARSYATTVPLDMDLSVVSWEISHRAKRRAGACRYDPSTGDVTIRLTWAAYETFGWERFTGVIRHELIHAYEFQETGTSGHGPQFAKLAEKLDAPRHCKRFSEPRYWLACTSCDARIGRYRKSKVVKSPHEYRCGMCGGTLRRE